MPTLESHSKKTIMNNRRSIHLPGGWQLPPLGVHQGLALIIVAVALWSVAVIWLVLQGGEQWVGSWQDEVKVHVYVDEKYNSSVKSMQHKLMEVNGVYHVRIISGEETDEWMRRWLGGEDLDVKSFSQHLPTSIEVSLEEPRKDGVLAEIQQIAVNSHGLINEDEFKLVKAGDVLGTIQSLAWFATLTLGLAMALIVSNTLRMILLARADEVHLMRLMGAKEWFVRLPFVLEGLLLGAGSGFAAWLLTWPLIWFSYDWQESLGVDLSGWVMLVPLILGGAIVGCIGALIATANIVSPETES